jgi:hypothetical protein
VVEYLRVFYHVGFFFGYGGAKAKNMVKKLARASRIKVNNGAPS